jgi:hypothetical protein
MNRQDMTRGFFFERRFKSVAILDEESLLATFFRARPVLPCADRAGADSRGLDVAPPDRNLPAIPPLQPNCLT